MKMLIELIGLLLLKLNLLVIFPVYFRVDMADFDKCLCYVFRYYDKN